MNKTTAILLFPIAALCFSGQATAKTSQPNTKSPSITSIFVLPIQQSEGINKAKATMLTEVASTELTSVVPSSLRVVNLDDFTKLADHDRLQQSLNSDDVKGLVEIGRALGTSHLLHLVLSRFGGQYVISAKLLSVEKSQVVFRTIGYAKADNAALLWSIRNIIGDMAGRLAWKQNWVAKSDDKRKDVKENVKLTVRSMWGALTPLMHAATLGYNDECAKLIAEGAPVNAAATEVGGITALMLAASFGRAQICRQLIAAGANVNKAGRNGRNALMLASEKGQAEVCKLLIAAGARVNANMKKGQTALSFAAHNGHLEVSKVLLAAGAQTEARGQYGWTPLMLAAAKGHTETCKQLIAAGAKIDAATPDGWTPLMIAAKHGHHNTCAALMDAGADTKKRNKRGLDAAEIAKKHQATEAHRLILKYQERRR